MIIKIDIKEKRTPLGRDYSKYYEKILKNISPKNIIEWGPGMGIDNDKLKGQTQLALELTNANITVIEQDKKWLPKPQDRLTVKHIQVNDPEYINIEKYKDFDIFFVDSRRRQECIENAFKYANDDVLVFVHDAERQRYKKFINLFPYIIYFNNERFACLCKNEKQFNLIKNLF